MIHVFGHRNPDSDSICSALVLADWLNGQGRPATPWRLGELRTETRFILECAGRESPALLTQPLDGLDVWLVDFSDFEQGPESLARANIVGLVDHHRLGSLRTEAPFDAWIRAVGCSATIVLSLLDELTRPQARLLLGAIMSDTLCLTSPTTTPLDEAACQRLAPLAELSLAEFGQQLLAAKTDLSGLSAAQLLRQDEKGYQVAGVNLVMSQIEVGSLAQITPMMAELEREMAQRVHTDDLDAYVLMVTDLGEGASRICACHHPERSLPQLPKQAITLPGMVSRKKQGLPWLTAQLSQG
ncbi:DHHA2 domain-containing protein [Aeromonas molluscorum]|uniref:DHHA2 domain-containing protein n=1 Tax=Aeromonas molluscorum TaxID=271417 RepID=UPI003F19D5E2